MKTLHTWLQKLLLHPVVTLLTVLTGVVSGLSVIGTQLTAMGMQLGPLAWYVPKSAPLVTTIVTVATICTVLAGIGRSFLSFVDKGALPPQTAPTDVIIAPALPGQAAQPHLPPGKPGN